MILTIQKYAADGFYCSFDFVDGLVYGKQQTTKEKNRIYFSYNTKEECVNQLQKKVDKMQPSGKKYNLQLLINNIIKEELAK